MEARSWQLLPFSFDSIAFSVGFFSVSWYALCYLTGAVLVVILLFRKQHRIHDLSPDALWSLVLSVLWGVLLGARLGYVFLYGDRSFLEEPWRIFSPYDFTTGVWIGIRGMSFFGGLFGGAVGLFLFARRAKIPFWQLADFVIPLVPLALFFGRLGNFFNHELLGRETGKVWGMYFPDGGGWLRHPSQLYEALGEGLILLLLLFWIGKKAHFPGFLSSIFLVGYGILRLFFERFREPDQGASSIFSGIYLNSLLSLALIILGISLFFSLRRAWYNQEELKKL